MKIQTSPELYCLSLVLFNISDNMRQIQDLKWAFFSYWHNLGDFTRALERDKGIKRSGASNGV